MPSKPQRNVYEDYARFLYVYLRKGFFFGLEREFNMLVSMRQMFNREVPLTDRSKLILLRSLSFLV